MKEGRKPEYPEKCPGDELQNTKAPSETRTRTTALVACEESRRANRYTTRGPSSILHCDIFFQTTGMTVQF